MESQNAFHTLLAAKRQYCQTNPPTGGWICGSGFANRWRNRDILDNNNNWLNDILALPIEDNAYITRRELLVRDHKRVMEAFQPI
jgi:hypothetical protein